MNATSTFSSLKTQTGSRAELLLQGKEDPMNLPTVRKWVIAIIVSITATSVTMLSSCWSLIQLSIREEYKIGEEVAVLGISMFVLGISIGPLFLSPISEYHGRKIVYVLSSLLSLCFQLLPSFCGNFGGVLFGRFMSGFFGSASLAVAGGTISDIFAKEQIGPPLTLFTLSPFIGPALGPLESGFIQDSSLSYRWTFHIILIVTAITLFLVLLLVPETYKPFLLRKKFRKLLKDKKIGKHLLPYDKIETTLVQSVVLSYKRPILLLLRDPMMLSLCVYTGLVLAILYLLFDGIPYICSTIYGFRENGQGMAFLGLIVGVLMASPAVFASQYIYEKLAAKNNCIGFQNSDFRCYWWEAWRTPWGFS